MPLEPGQTLSHYRIVDKIGEGGMGEVYLAKDLQLKREVALKILPADLAMDPSGLLRFQREAEAVAALNHPNIVTIHSVEKEGSLHFLSMERVEGESLDKLLPPEGFPLAKVFDLAAQVADALSAAHEHGVTHRDLKPANIMITKEGRVKVLDFGLAKLTQRGRGRVRRGPDRGGARRPVTHRSGPGGGDSAVHVAGAAGGQDRRPPHRPVLAGRPAL